MKITIVSMALCCVSCAATNLGRVDVSPTESTASNNRFTAYLGRRSLDEDRYAPVDEQIVFALEYSQEPTGSPVGFEIGAAASGDSEGIWGPETEGSTGEFYGGLRKSFGDGPVRPYVGGGLAFISSRYETPTAKDDDTSPAAYLHGGIEFHLNERLMMGVDVRSLFGSDMTLFGVEADANYTQAALFFAAQF